MHDYIFSDLRIVSNITRRGRRGGCGLVLNASFPIFCLNYYCQYFLLRVQHVTKWWIFLSSKFPWHANNVSEQPASVVYWFMWFVLHSILRSLTTEVSQQQKCNEPVNWNYLRFSFPHRKAHSSQARLELRNVHFPIFINIQLLKQLSETFRAVLLQTMRLGEHEFPYKLIHDELRYLYCIFFPHEIQRLQGNCGRTTDVAWHWRKQTLPKRLAHYVRLSQSFFYCHYLLTLNVLLICRRLTELRRRDQYYWVICPRCLLILDGHTQIYTSSQPASLTHCQKLLNRGCIQ